MLSVILIICQDASSLPKSGLSAILILLSLDVHNYNQYNINLVWFKNISIRYKVHRQGLGVA